MGRAWARRLCTHPGSPDKVTQKSSVRVMGWERENLLFSLAASSFARDPPGKNTTLPVPFLQSSKYFTQVHAELWGTRSPSVLRDRQGEAERAPLCADSTHPIHFADRTSTVE